MTIARHTRGSPGSGSAAALQIAAMAAAAGAVASAWMAVRPSRAAPSVSEAAIGSPPALDAAWPEAPRLSPSDWAPFRASPASMPSAAAEDSAAAGRFRLAGTLLMQMGPPGRETARHGRAVIDDMETRQQCLLAEGESAGALRVLRIELDRVVAEIDGRVAVLSMRFDGSATSDTAAPGAVHAAAAGMEPIEINRFGRRVQPDRWLIERGALLDYYREIREDPSRVAKLYETFKPRREDGRIAGYELDIIGEREFLNAVGLQQGDVVRAVNSMKMTSQSRAEFFISEFLKEQLNAVVLDIERSGQPQKLVYLIR